jgi:transposase
MITQEEDMEVHALKKQGWSLSAIARHTGLDRKTVRAYLNGDREVGVRKRGDGDVDPFDRIEPYVRQRLREDPHVRAKVLFGEIQALPGGYERAYETFCRQIRRRELRPHCEACSGVKGRAHVDIEHPPGEEVQWDWLELHDTPWGDATFLLVGALSHSGRFAGWFCESMDQPHLIAAIHHVLVRLSGTPKAWRVDRMATAINPNTGRVQASFGAVAKHHGVTVVPCPPRRPNRKGVVENAIGYLTQSWWRTARVSSPTQAQTAFDQWCLNVADLRLRDGSTVAQAAAAEPLLVLPPAPFPTVISVERQVAMNALVSFHGNRYSTPPGLVGATVTIEHRHGSNQISFHSSGRVIAVHTLAPAGSGRIVRLPEHTAALENVVLAQFNTDRPCRTKLNRPPSPTAMALAAQLGPDLAADPVIDLDVYRRIIEDGIA